MKTFLSTLAGLSVICAAAFVSNSASADVYDAQAAIAARAALPGGYNTAGQFMLGTYSTPLTPTSFGLFTNLDFDDNIGGTGMDYIKNAGTDPNFVFNDSGTTQSIAGFTLAPDQIAAGPFQGPTVIRFTAPISGIYRINSFFEAIQTGGNTAPTGEVFDNNLELGSGVATFGTGYTYTNAGVFLSAGDNVDFVTDSLGSHFASTLVEATLTLVPEPSSYVALLGLGAVGLLTAARRRRNS